MDCDQQKVCELMTGELSIDDSNRLLEHLKVCKRCSERARIMGVLDDSFSKRRNRKKLKARGFLLAAAAMMIIVIPLSQLLWKQEGTSSRENIRGLATRQHYPYFPLEVRSSGNESKKKAFQAYREGRLHLAERQFRQIQGNDPEIQFFRGVTRYLLSHDEEAILDLNKARLSIYWRRAATWYLANLHLRQGRYPDALNELAILQSEEGRFNTEAKRLVDKIQLETSADK